MDTKNALTDIGQIVALVKQYTHLKLDVACGLDREYAKKWYERNILTGAHSRFIMKPGMTINSLEDGVVYRAFNCDDAKALELMKRNPDYAEYFLDLQPESSTFPDFKPEAPEAPEAPAEGDAAENAPTDDAVEPTEEEKAAAEAEAAKRSEAAKKAAATRAAKKAAEEAKAAEESPIKEFE